jgi:NADPH:quinone reductase-like Zn-dependent oxidoreductase
MSKRNGKKNGNGHARTNGHGTAEAGAPRRLWVAGATGFLGSHLTALLVERGHEVIAVSRNGGHVASTWRAWTCSIATQWPKARAVPTVHSW